MGSRESFSLRQVSDLTGLSEFTLRGWESRYQAFQPHRSPTGRRQYSAADIKRAMMLRELLQRGHRIGSVAGLSDAALNQLLDQTASTGPQEPESLETCLLPESTEILKALSLHDWDKLRKAIRGNRSDLSDGERLREVFLPLLRLVGQRVGTRALSISQEHIFSALLKEEIYRMISERTLPRKPGRSKFVVTTPERDFHEIGVLIAQFLLVDLGFYSLYLGPNSPKEDLCETALRFGATHILLASTVSRKEGAKEDLYSYVHFLDSHLAPSVQIWLGGRNTSEFLPALRRTCINLASLTDLEIRLKALKDG